MNRGGVHALSEGWVWCAFLINDEARRVNDEARRAAANRNHFP